MKESVASNISPYKQRLMWVDELKGTVLVLICLGHLAGMVSIPSMVKNILEMLGVVRVPTFFFLSGLLYSAKNETFREYFFRKMKSLFIPYLLLSILFSFLDPYIYNPQYLIEKMHYPRLTQLIGGLDAKLQAQIEFFFGDILCTAFGISSRATLPLWFVFVLYIVTIVFHGFYIRLNSHVYLAIVAFVSFILAVLLSYFGIGDYFKIGPCLMALFFYWLGTVYKKIVEKLPHIVAYVGFLISLFLSLYFIHEIVENVSYVNGVFPVRNSHIFLICSLSGIFCFVFLFNNLSKINFWGYNYVKGILRNIARNSLIILTMHYWGLVVYHLYFSPYISQRYQIYAAVIFVVLVCILSIIVFRTRLYMLIGGKRAKQTIRECLSIS